MLHGGYARGRLVRSDTSLEREEVETMTKLAELGWGKADPSFRQFFTTQFIPGGTPEQHQRGARSPRCCGFDLGFGCGIGFLAGSHEGCAPAARNSC